MYDEQQPDITDQEKEKLQNLKKQIIIAVEFEILQQLKETEKIGLFITLAGVHFDQCFLSHTKKGQEEKWFVETEVLFNWVHCNQI